jgi:hypothetical protein
MMVRTAPWTSNDSIAAGERPETPRTSDPFVLVDEAHDFGRRLGAVVVALSANPHLVLVIENH